MGKGSRSDRGRSDTATPRYIINHLEVGATPTIPHNLMNTRDYFSIAIRAYLDALAKHDEQFALKYKNPNKSLQECCNYILNQVKRLATQGDNGVKRNGFLDEEIFGMAVHYYDEEVLPQEELKPVSNYTAIVNTHIETPKEDLKKSDKKTAKAQPKTAPKAQPATPKKGVVTKPIAPAKATAQPKAKKPVESKQMDLFADFAEFNPFK